MAIATWVVRKAGKLPIGKEVNWHNKKRKTQDKSLRNEKNTAFWTHPIIFKATKGGKLNWHNKKRKTPDKSLRNEKNTMNEAKLPQSPVKPNNLISVE